MSRLMDRPIRPVIHPGWFHETQLLSWVLSYDQGHPPVPLAITAASAALALSEVPLLHAVAGVSVSTGIGDNDAAKPGEFSLDLDSRTGLNISPGLGRGRDHVWC